MSLRHLDELPAARGVTVSHETVRQWGLNFGQGFADQTDAGCQAQAPIGTWTRLR